MTHSPELDHLAARWSDAPEGTAFAALADGLRKVGALAEAEAVAVVGLTRHPELIPGLIALARVREAQGDPEGAEATLQRALAVDPSHPVVLEALSELAAAGGASGAARAWATMAEVAAAAETPVGDVAESAVEEPAVASSSSFVDPLDAAASSDAPWTEEGEWEEDEFLVDPDAPELITESLANLYEAQGHVSRAAEAFRALADRHPEQAGFLARAERLDAQLVAHRPRPYDAAASGGTSLGEWLTAVALAAPAAPARAEGFDAFYDAQLPAARDTADFTAFQDWLRGLGR